MTGLEEKVCAAVARVLERFTDPVPTTDITPATSLETMNLDSLDMMEIIVELEDEFNIRIQEEVEFDESVSTVGDLARIVKEAQG